MYPSDSKEASFTAIRRDVSRDVNFYIDFLCHTVYIFISQGIWAETKSSLPGQVSPTIKSQNLYNCKYIYEQSAHIYWKTFNIT